MMSPTVILPRYQKPADVGKRFAKYPVSICLPGTYCSRRSIGEEGRNMQQKLDFTAAWNDALALLKANLDVVLPVVGVFILLPQIIFGFMLPQPEFVPGQSESAIYAQSVAWLGSMAPALLVIVLLSIIGNLAVYALVLRSEKPNVGQALTMALSMLLPMLLASILSAIATTIGLILLFIPGLYLMIKFSLVGPALVAENIKNPIAALQRSWQLTKGNSLYILAFFLIIGIVGIIVLLITSAVFTGIFGMILPESAGLLVAAIITGLLQTILSVVFLFIVIAVYRQLSASH
jgi:hypothetical protein